MFIMLMIINRMGMFYVGSTPMSNRRIWTLKLHTQN